MCDGIVQVQYVLVYILFFFFFFKQKTAYERRISDWSSDVCSSDLLPRRVLGSAGVRWMWSGVAIGPISVRTCCFKAAATSSVGSTPALSVKIGRASCRERVCQYV